MKINPVIYMSLKQSPIKEIINNEIPSVRKVYFYTDREAFEKEWEIRRENEGKIPPGIQRLSTDGLHDWKTYWDQGRLPNQRAFEWLTDNVINKAIELVGNRQQVSIYVAVVPDILMTGNSGRDHLVMLIYPQNTDSALIFDANPNEEGTV